MKNLTVSVAVCNPLPEMFEKFIISLMQYTPEMNTLIVVDNATKLKDAYKTIIAKHSFPGLNIKVIEKEKNVGFGAAHNHALTHVKTKYFAVLNDDIEFFELWASRMIEKLENDRKIAQVGPKKGVCNVLDFHGGGHPSDTDDPEYIEGSCFIMPTKLAIQYGLFDSRYKIAYFEDSDLSLRLRKDGYLLATVDINWKHHRAVTSKKVSLDLLGYQIANAAKFKQRWCGYLISKRFGDVILVRRGGSFGDVFLTTPILQALKKRDPSCIVVVMTAQPDMIRYSKHIDYFAPIGRPVYCDRIINLDLAYEDDFTQHIVDAYAKIAGVKVEHKIGILTMPKEEMTIVDNQLPKDIGKFIVLDYSEAWKGKRWDVNRYNKLANMLQADGYKIISIGLGDERGDAYAPDIDFVGKLTALQTSYLIYLADMYIGHEGLFGHVAQSAQTPSIVMYGCTLPRYVNTFSALLRPVITPAACGGCRHRKATGHYIVCPREHACMDMITVDMVYEAFKETINVADATRKLKKEAIGQ